MKRRILYAIAAMERIRVLVANLPFQHPIEKGDKAVLAVLASGTQLGLQTPPLYAQIGGQRGIAVMTMVGPAHGRAEAGKYC